MNDAIRCITHCRLCGGPLDPPGAGFVLVHEPTDEELAQWCPACQRNAADASAVRDALQQDTYRCPSKSAIVASPGDGEPDDSRTGPRCEKWRGHPGSHSNHEGRFILFWSPGTGAGENRLHVDPEHVDAVQRARRELEERKAKAREFYEGNEWRKP